MPIVTRSIEIKAAPSKVWKWLESQDALRQWISQSLDIDLQVGGRYRLQGDDTTFVSGVVLEIVPEGRLVLSWLEEDRGWVHPGRLVLSLEPIHGGTKVTLIHDGFAGIGKPGWQDTVQGYERGADRHEILHKLAALVDALD